MFSRRYFRLTTALLTLVASAATFDINAKTNVAIYYGQGPNEAALGLKDFCTNSNVDIIPLAFLDIYPAQGNGYPGTNFASSCTGAVFSGPGYNGVDDPTKNDLQSDCPTLVDGIGFCQAQGKKILLSLGGAPGATHYQLTSTSDAEYLADFLWGAFGPLQAGNTWPRPFDDVATGSHSVDGFDFDIEVIQPGEQQYYITMINRLIGYFPTGPGAKKYLITGAPQCIVPDNQMGDMISAVPFDILFVQYYNTDACSARSWITANPSYPSVPETSSGFGFEFAELLYYLKGGASANAKIYFGLPGAPAAASPGEYLTIPEATLFLEAYFCQPSFGGVMIWEGIYAYDNIINGQSYQNNIKNILTSDSSDPTLSKCPATTPTYTLTSASPTATACVTCTKPYTIVGGDTCSALWNDNGLSSTTFYSLNPNINCNNLQIGQIICLGGTVGSCTTTSATPTPTACPTCTSTHSVIGGDTCSALWTSNSISSTLFYALNPGIDCGDLQIGQLVCVGGTVGPCTTTTTTTSTSTTPTPTACPSCTSSHSIIGGDTCSALWNSNGISSTLFYALNPGIDCGDLQIGQIVCVGGTVGPCTSTTTSATTTPSTSTSGTPTPTACPSCTSTHSVISGDTCSALWTSNSISSTLFYALNPGIDCGDLQLGQIVCVGGTVGPCTTSTTQSTTSTTSTTSSTSSTSSTTSTTSTSSTHSTTSSTHSTTSSSNSTHSTTGPTNSTHSTTTPRSHTSPTHLHSSPSAPSHPHSYTSYRNSTTHGHHTPSPVTHTITTTSVYTITSCPPTVTNCPIGHVTTDVRTITTTYCPGNAEHTPKITASPIKYTTSVVYTTLTYTITACPPTVTNCPARGSVTTETRALYTTICPVAEITAPVAIPASTAPGAPAKEASVSAVSYAPETTLNFSPEAYSTVVPKPSSISSSFAVVYQTVSVMPVAASSPSGTIVASASPVKPNTATFTGSATYTATLSIRGIMTIVLCIAGWALM